jgi:dolichol-phosphate mannosyltransferase
MRIEGGVPKELATSSLTSAETNSPAFEAPIDLSIIIPALNEGPNLVLLLPQLLTEIESLGARSEILIVTREIDPETAAAAKASGALVLKQRERGYGGALVTAFRAARGAYLLTMDADLSHRPEFMRDLWRSRESAEVLVASRYVQGGSARMPASRFLLSRVLNLFFGLGLSLRVRDMSSGFRLYKASAIQREEFVARDFNILQEILVRAYSQGWQIQEVPFEYAPRRHGSSNARIVRFGLAYLRTFKGLWKLRNRLECADYEDRAYHSHIPLQRYWQRTRFRHIKELIRGEGPVLDVGCGSSRIVSALPPGSVAVDVLLPKLRYARRFGKALVQASAVALPFRNGSFPCVLCSRVIEDVPKVSPILDELERVLASGGRLVLGTPDCSKWEWVMTKKLCDRFAPGAREHISHYSHSELVERFESRDFKLEAVRYILRGEMILAFRKA